MAGAAGLALAFATTPVAQVVKLGDIEDLVAKAQRQGSVRVIIQLAGDFPSETDLADPTAVAWNRYAIRQLQDLVLAQLSGGSVSVRDVRRLATVPFITAEVDTGALRMLEASGLVAKIEEDVPRPLLLASSGPLVGASDAWSAGYSGSGWTVAILDTGVEKTHPFLSGKVVSEACYSTSSLLGPSLCPGGVDSTAPDSGVPCSSAIASSCDHGTHVAGIATGKGSSFSGIARDATVIAIQVFSSSLGSLVAFDSDLMAALERVYALRTTFNIASVNMSLGTSEVYASPCDTDPLKPLIDQLRAAGIATVIASGNSSSSTGLSSPGCISTAVSVGSTTKTDAVSYFSNTADFLSLLAPGSSINSSVLGGAFGSKSGTSMAAPHVAGAWAVLRQRKPTASVSEILNALQNTGAEVADSRNGLTFKRLKVKAAIDRLVIAEMALDTPSGGTVTQPFAVAGWAIDPAAATGTGVDAVHVWAYPTDGGAPLWVGAHYGNSRQDVATAFGNTRFTNSGYHVIATGLPPRSYRIVVSARSAADGTFNNTRTADVTVGPSTHMALDTLAHGASVTQPFVIGGWALDAAATGGTGVDAVHVWAYPLAGGSPLWVGANHGGSRADVATAFGDTRFANSGYHVTATGLPPGDYHIVVSARSTVTGTFDISRTVDVSVGEGTYMALDAPVETAIVTQPFVVGGWALDAAAASGTGVDAVHVWAYPAGGAPPLWVGANYGGARSDVALAFGDSRFTNSGYHVVSTTLPAGKYQIVVSARSTVTGTFNNVRVADVTVIAGST